MCTCFFEHNTYTIGTMPITKGAKKAHDASLKKRVFNERRKRDMKGVVKEIREKLVAKDAKGAEDLMSRAYKAIDKAAKRGIIKKNTASRTKSRLVLAIRKVAGK